jgi:hypothetical protein
MNRAVLLDDVRRLTHLLEIPDSTDEQIINAAHVLEHDFALWRDEPLPHEQYPSAWHQREAGGLASGVAIALFISCVAAAGALLS